MNQVRSRSLIALFTIVLLVSLPVLAFAGDNKPVARMATSISSVEWQVASPNDRVTLSVTGPDGFAYTKTFPAGTNPSLRLQDITSEDPNGSYSWELRVLPRISKDVREQLSKAREMGDDEEIARIRKAAGLSTNAVVQSGGLTVHNGTFVAPDQSEPRNAPISASATSVTASATAGNPHGLPISAMDTVIPDDLIVQSSACVGFDCVDGESFGTDTIRLKENNLRINFLDTSSSAGYPATDWTLEANDTTSGGANRFSIVDNTAVTTPFTVKGAAPTNSVFVDTNGKVGFRNGAPGLDLHITTGDTPAMRYEQTSGSGFTAQTWDIGANEANFFVRDLTGGSKLSFRIRPGAPTSSIDIAANGNVGVGTASPGTSRMNLSDTTQLAARLALTGQEFLAASNTSTDGIGFLLGVNRTGNRQLWIADTASMAVGSTNKVVRIGPNSGDISVLTTAGSPTSMVLNAGGGNIGIGVASPTSPIQHSNGATLSTGGVWTNACSRALKDNITDLQTDDAKKALADLQPVTYTYKAAPSEHHVGFIAEDVPELVATTDRKGLSPLDIVAVLTSVVKDQQKTIDELKARVDEMQAQK
jgi:hypothetical protein